MPKSPNTPTSTITLIIRAISDDVSMGEDLHLLLPKSTTISTLALHIKDLKDIPTSRMVFFTLPSNEISKSKWENTLANCSLYNNSTVCVRPTTFGCWEWEGIEYHNHQTVLKIISCIDKLNGTSLDELKKEIEMPYCLKRAKVFLLGFIRTYPELFYVDVKTQGNDVRVFLNDDYKLPTWT